MIMLVHRMESTVLNTCSSYSLTVPLHITNAGGGANDL